MPHPDVTALTHPVLLVGVEYMAARRRHREGATTFGAARRLEDPKLRN